MKFANEQEIRAGEFFILNGITVFVAEVNQPHTFGNPEVSNSTPIVGVPVALMH